MRFRFVAFCAAVCVVAVGFGASGGDARAAESDWPEGIETQHWAGAYWWWPGSAVDKESIDWNLENMAQGGIRNAHIIPIYGARGYEDRYIDYLSPEWMAMLDYTVKKANALDMNVDMTTGTGWCFGGPRLDADTWDTVAGYDSEKKTLTFKPGMNVKRAAPGGGGHMINPLSPSAMDFYLERFSKAFDESNCLLPRAQYHDSFEYKGDWSPELLDAFKEKRGYDLADHFEAFFKGGEDAEQLARVKCDYRITMADLHHEAMSKWAGWARKRGMLTRNQAHGAPANLLDLYALADIPETEMFGAPQFPIPGFRCDPDISREGDSDRRICMLASSAAHVAHEPGRQLVSAETGTWMRDHWHGTLGQMKLELDLFFLYGVNHIIYHGCCFSAKDAPWPGWFFYASTKMDPRNSIWRDAPKLNQFVARCQSVLQAGRPANDILLYWPIHDLWSNPGGSTMKLTVHGEEWMNNQPVGAVAQKLLDTGYAFDFISDRMVEELACRDDKIQAPGGAYQAIVVPKCTHIPIETLGKLAALAKRGATVIFEDAIPSDVPGLARLDKRRAGLAKERDRLVKAGAIVAPDVLAAAQDAGVARELFKDMGLDCIRRETKDGYYYFIANHSAKPVDGWVPLALPFTSATLHDPMTGASGSLAVREAKEASQLYLQLQAGESTIIAVSDAEASGPKWPYRKREGASVLIAGEWTIDFIDGAPALPASFAQKALASWTNAPDKKAESFAGTARYITTFTLSAAADDWLLDLGDVRESARITINGKEVGTLVALPFTIPVGDFLKSGPNTLEVEVTNLTANRIRDLEIRGVDWKIMRDANIVNMDYKKFEPDKWPLTESGLLGPVQLIPMKTLDPAAL